MVLTLGLGSAGLPPGAALTQGPTGPSRLSKKERLGSKLPGSQAPGPTQTCPIAPPQVPTGAATTSNILFLVWLKNHHFIDSTSVPLTALPS